MRCHSRRRLLQGSLALAGFSLLSGCEKGPKVPRIGFLAVGSREGRAFLIEGFLQGLREHGYVEGQNIVIEYRLRPDCHFAHLRPNLRTKVARAAYAAAWQSKRCGSR